jgi:hypothetical protein
MHILPLEWWDEIVGPKGKSYLYNEQSPSDMQASLDKTLVDDAFQPPPISDFVHVNPDKISANTYDVCIEHILSALPGYKSRYVDVKTIRMHEAGVAFVQMMICVHKPSCAFGRVLDVELFYTTSEKTHVVMIKIKGLVSEDNLEFQSRSMDISSLSASASPWSS